MAATPPPAAGPGDIEDTAPGLDEVAAALVREGNGYAIDTPEAWAQGRTLYGGMTAALSLLAATRDRDAPPPLRSAQFTFAAPATGRLLFEPTELRRGRSATVIAVDCRAGDALAARASFVFGAPRESAVTHERTAAGAWPAPDECRPLYRTRRPLPGFLARYDYRLASAGDLFDPSAVPELALWIRLRAAASCDPVVALLALADAPPSAAMVNFPKPAPVSTMTWQLDLHGPLSLPGDWHLVTSSSECAREGYSVQAMRVFAADGTPIATGRQTVAIFA